MICICGGIATYGERARTAIAFSFNADFQRVLNQHMVREVETNISDE
jgi:hypothetical protein